MKYVISDKGEVNIGGGLHRNLSIGMKGEIISAGECEKLEDGWTVFGQSYGFGIKAKNADREVLNKTPNPITK